MYYLKCDRRANISRKQLQDNGQTVTVTAVAVVGRSVGRGELLLLLMVDAASTAAVRRALIDRRTTGTAGAAAAAAGRTRHHNIPDIHADASSSYNVIT